MQFGRTELAQTIRADRQFSPYIRQIRKLDGVVDTRRPEVSTLLTAMRGTATVNYNSRFSVRRVCALLLQDRFHAR